MIDFCLFVFLSFLCVTKQYMTKKNKPTVSLDTVSCVRTQKCSSISLHQAALVCGASLC